MLCWLRQPWGYAIVFKAQPAVLPVYRGWFFPAAIMGGNHWHGNAPHLAPTVRVRDRLWRAFARLYQADPQGRVYILVHNPPTAETYHMSPAGGAILTFLGVWPVIRFK